MRIGVLTVSDGVSSHTREDTAGTWLVQACRPLGEVVRRAVADEIEQIAEALRDWEEDGVDVIISTGGTGLGPRDVTPEATRMVIAKEVPGIAESLRRESAKYTPMGMLSRGLAGVRGSTLILNLPGSAHAVKQLFPVVEPIMAHAVDLLHGNTSHEKP